MVHKTIFDQYTIYSVIIVVINYMLCILGATQKEYLICIKFLAAETGIIAPSASEPKSAELRLLAGLLLQTDSEDQINARVITRSCSGELPLRVNPYICHRTIKIIRINITEVIVVVISPGRAVIN